RSSGCTWSRRRVAGGYPESCSLSWSAARSPRAGGGWCSRPESASQRRSGSTRRRATPRFRNSACTGVTRAAGASGSFLRWRRSPPVDRSLGSHTVPAAVDEIVETGWAGALAPVAGQIATAGDFLRAEIASGRRYLPAGTNILRAFTQPFDQVRVLIVGQDPYPTPGHAVGLSFSVQPQVRPLPRSLANIFDEYTADLGHPQPSCGDLTPWAQRGVLLLNRVLTVRPSNPASHRGKGWEAVTECAIRALTQRSRPL